MADRGKTPVGIGAETGSMIRKKYAFSINEAGAPPARAAPPAKPVTRLKAGTTGGHRPPADVRYWSTAGALPSVVAVPVSDSPSGGGV